ncbi:uncharacterized protein [Coffea arabica]|uniref:Uncharacterized protein isoform X2 n=1 Tax=Coffea arabica TaxID=13443 RepID=A0A6P6WEI0_COFAR|nr:uncharacterized protein LOC113732084 isoform X4 [Coffea arabica]
MPLRNTFKSGTQDGEVRKQSNFGWHWISYLPTRRQRPPEQIQKKILYGHHLDMAFPSNEEASDYHLTSTEVELAEVSEVKWVAIYETRHIGFRFSSP